MPARKTYEYAFIRIVPRVERGEFLNLGVILFSKPARFLSMKYHIPEKRLQVFSEDIDLQEVREYLEAWELISRGDPAGGAIAKLDEAGRFRWITATKSTIIQCSRVHPGLCEDPVLALNDLFEKYVC